MVISPEVDVARNVSTDVRIPRPERTSIRSDSARISPATVRAPSIEPPAVTVMVLPGPPAVASMPADPICTESDSVRLITPGVSVAVVRAEIAPADVLATMEEFATSETVPPPEINPGMALIVPVGNSSIDGPRISPAIRMLTPLNAPALIPPVVMTMSPMPRLPREMSPPTAVMPSMKTGFSRSNTAESVPGLVLRAEKVLMSSSSAKLNLSKSLDSIESLSA